jgi:hypothetical protein
MHIKDETWPTFTIQDVAKNKRFLSGENITRRLRLEQFGKVHGAII